MDKTLEEMSVLELKGVLFDINQQISNMQMHAEKNVIPLIKRKLEEEKNE